MMMISSNWLEMVTDNVETVHRNMNNLQRHSSPQQKVGMNIVFVDHQRIFFSLHLHRPIWVSSEVNVKKYSSGLMIFQTFHNLKYFL